MLLWYLAFLLPVITVFAHRAYIGGKISAARKVELWVSHLVFWGIGVAGIFMFIANSFGDMPSWIAERIGASGGSEFQYIMGIVFLAFGVLGIFAPAIKGGFLAGTALIAVVYGIYEGFVVLSMNVSLGMLVYTLIYDWAGSVLLLVLLRIYRRLAGRVGFWECCSRIKN